MSVQVLLALLSLIQFYSDATLDFKCLSPIFFSNFIHDSSRQHISYDKCRFFRHLKNVFDSTCGFRLYCRRMACHATILLYCKLSEAPLRMYLVL